MSRRDWGDALAAVFTVAVLMLLVRPNSLAPAFIAAAGAALTALVGYAADPQTAAPPAAATPAPAPNYGTVTA
jgi:hypothetical protein